MTWEKTASDKLEELVIVVREPFRAIIKSNAQAHAEAFARSRKTPHVTIKEAVLGFLRARSHKLTEEAKMILADYHMTENDFTNYSEQI